MAAKVQFQAADIEGELRARNRDDESLGLIARRDLLRYYQCLGAELRSIRPTEAEARVICDYLHRYLDLRPIDPAGSLHFALALGVDRATSSEWGVDAEALNHKIQALTWTQRLALVDAVERFWIDPTGRDALRRAGLITDIAGHKSSRDGLKGKI